MPYTLDNEEAKTATKGRALIAISVNVDNKTIRIAYRNTDISGERLVESPFLLVRRDTVKKDESGVEVPDKTEMTDLITRASEIASADIYAALKQAAYEAIADDTGSTGTLS